MVKVFWVSIKICLFWGHRDIKYYRRFNINESLQVSWHGFMKYKSHYSSQ